MRRNWVLAFVASLPWLIIATLMWYVWPRSSPQPSPGAELSALYPEVRRGLVIALVTSWIAVPLLLGKLLRGRKPGSDVGTPLFVNAVLVAATYLMVFASVEGVIPPTATVTPFVLWIGMLLVALNDAERGKKNRLPIYAGFSVLFLLILPLVSVLLPGWRDLAQVRGPDARLYHVQNWSVLMGRTNALTEEISRGPLFLRTRVIASAPDEMGIDVLIPPDSSATAAKATPKQVLLVVDSRWFVFGRRHEVKGDDTLAVNLVYDLTTSRLYNYSDLRRAVPTDQPRSWEEVEGLLSKRP